MITIASFIEGRFPLPPISLTTPFWQIQVASLLSFVTSKKFKATMLARIAGRLRIISSKLFTVVLTLAVRLKTSLPFCV